MRNQYLLVPVMAILLLSGCYKQTVQGSYATPNKQVEGIALGITTSPVVGPLVSGSTIGSAATTGYIGNMAGAMTARHRLMNTLAQRGVQVIAQGDKVRIILSADRFFYPNSPTLNPHDYPTLDFVAALLKEYGRTPILIAGYTDNVADTEQAKKFTQQQAESVLAYLWVHGIEHNHVKAMGYGSQHPIANNETVAGSAANRRVEITLRAGC